MDTPYSEQRVIPNSVAVVLALADADDHVTHEPVVWAGILLQNLAGVEGQHIIRAAPGCSP